MLKPQETLQAAARALTFRHLTPEQWRMWRRLMRRQPQWFILRQSGRRDDRWCAVAGPFCSPEDARAALNRLASPVAGPLRHTSERWQVASLPETMRVYHGNVPLLVEDLTASEKRSPHTTQCEPEHFAQA